MRPNFLDLSGSLSNYETAKVVVLPIPYEATVTYGKGTADGPAAIIEASHQVEFYDREFDCEPVNSFGIHTLDSLIPVEKSSEMVDEIYNAAIPHIKAGKFVVGLGGEHSVSAGLVKAQAEFTNSPITIVQIDAHSDLRNSYEGNIYNHACVARRFLENENVERILQFGIRSISTEEIDFIRSNSERIRTWFKEDTDSNEWQKEFISLISGKKIYLTIDVDGLDPSVIAATGTPEPDGLCWKKTVEIIKLLTCSAELIALDCVELAPVLGMHLSEYAAAKLVYKVLAIKYNTLTDKTDKTD